MRKKIDFKRGITREVVLIGKYALKFPSIRSWWLFLEGLQCNMNEVSRETCSDKFCPISMSIPGGFLVVMKRCDPYTEWTYEGMQQFYSSNECHAFVENKQCSFGYLGDRLVAVDYGS